MPTQYNCAIHQPNLFPRLSTLAKLYLADVWIALDDVQFVRRDYQHRCRLGQPANPEQSQWLSLSVHRPHGRASRINEITPIEPERCRKRVRHLLQQYYGKSPHWPLIRHRLHPLLDLIGASAPLAEIAEASTRILLDLVDWSGHIQRSSELPNRLGRCERLADLTTAVGASTYLCGSGGKRYLNCTPFTDQGLTVRYVRPPEGHSTGPWSAPQELTTLWALTTFGPQTLSEELKGLRSSANESPGTLGC